MRRTLFLFLINWILLSSGNSPERISDFLVEGIRNCQTSINTTQFFYSDVTQISPSWFVFATTIAIPPPSPAPGWQGAIFYKVRSGSLILQQNISQFKSFRNRLQWRRLTREITCRGFTSTPTGHPVWRGCGSGTPSYKVRTVRFTQGLMFFSLGFYCKIEEIDYVDDEVKISKTSKFRDNLITYSPPNFHSFGISPNSTPK